MKKREHILQSSCVKWFRLQYPQYYYNLFAIANGGKRDAITGAILKAEGVVAGVADMLLLVARKGFHGVGIEFKIDKNTQTEEQKKFEIAIKKEGFDYVIIKDFDTFYNIINSYLL